MNADDHGKTADDEIDEVVADARTHRYETDPHVAGWNHIPATTRWKYILYSSALIAYGSYSVSIDDLYVSSKRSSSGLHLHGLAAWLMYAALLCAAANLLSVVVDHYDRRNNERNYAAFARWSEIAGWLLVAASLVVAAVN